MSTENQRTKSYFRKYNNLNIENKHLRSFSLVRDTTNSSKPLFINHLTSMHVSQINISTLYKHTIYLPYFYVYYYEVTSLPFTAFMEEENYRLVIQRKRRKESEDDLFDGKFVYRCIVTNDWDSTEEEIITFYNARGANEKKFDVMNNDFGWSKLPCSFLNENTAFLLLTAIAANFYLYLIGKIAKVFTDLKPESRIKRFLFRFIAVPAKWIKTGRRWVLNIYSQKPYHLLWQTYTQTELICEKPNRKEYQVVKIGKQYFSSFSIWLSSHKHGDAIQSV